MAVVDARAGWRIKPGGQQLAVQPGRRIDPHPPGLARPPAGILEIVGNAGEGIGAAVPDIGIAVTVAVAGEAQLRGLGYGKALMWHAMAQSRMQGHSRIILVGDPEYYNQFGFRRDLALNIQLPGWVEERRFLALELVAGSMIGVHGMIGYAEMPAVHVARLSAGSIELPDLRLPVLLSH